MDELPWTFVGFYFAPDHGQRVWRFTGTAPGLSLLPVLLRRVASGGAGGEGYEVSSGQRFSIRVWERPGIDDEGIYGPIDTLKRLAALIEAWLAQPERSGDLRIDTEYAADAEYGIVVHETPDDIHPTAVTKETVAGGSGTMGLLQQGESFPPFPFSFYDIEDEVESEGLFTLTQDGISFEYRIKDEDEELLRDVHETDVPLAEIASVTYKRGVISPLVTIHTHSLKGLAGVPTTRPARVTLRFKRKDRDDVERMVGVLTSRLARD